MAANVLIVESVRTNAPSFTPALQKRGYDVWVTHSGREAIRVAADAPPDVIVLDAASMRTSGNRICAQLRKHFAETPIIHIKDFPENGAHADASELLYMPFTPRKLINRIERFLNADQGESIELGPFKLNLQHRLLTAHGKIHRLTPKLALLMEAFMRNPGRTLDRVYLMRHVWQTDYVGDTRTLDVHIRWIREVIENEPGTPRYIVTVRGAGYCFRPERQEQVL